jgi:hypothetical protein
LWIRNLDFNKNRMWSGKHAHLLSSGWSDRS